MLLVSLTTFFKRTILEIGIHPQEISFKDMCICITIDHSIRYLKQIFIRRKEIHKEDALNLK